jgi:hypothetical protein
MTTSLHSIISTDPSEVNRHENSMSFERKEAKLLMNKEKRRGFNTLNNTSNLSPIRRSDKIDQMICYVPQLLGETALEIKH